MNCDGVVQIDDLDCKKFLKVLSTEKGKKYLSKFADKSLIEYISDKLGISGVANIIAAIKTAKYYDMEEGENIIVVATDSISRYYSVLEEMDNPSEGEIERIYDRVIRYQEPSLFFEGDRYSRLRWHNLKYYTWIEQQGKTVEELNLMLRQEFWNDEAKKVDEIDEKIKAYREKHKSELNEMMGLK
jgi:hypothetical protein